MSRSPRCHVLPLKSATYTPFKPDSERSQRYLYNTVVRPHGLPCPALLVSAGTPAVNATTLLPATASAAVLTLWLPAVA